MKEKVQMSFICEQDDSVMQCTERGEFCTTCQKEVIDFTLYSVMDIKKFKEKNGSACGRFTTEQIDPNYLFPLEVPFKFKVATIISSLFITGLSGNSFSQSGKDPKVEQSRGNSNASNLTSKEIEEQMTNGKHVSASIGIPPDESLIEKSENKSKQKKYKRKKFYISKRFPFIRRRRMIRGMFF